ncbi:MAG: HMA2 domain-containing protein [Tissierella sp.]|uniref:HMA2 domain-containing protein n=1 Tax=Tissierella sp. TaxID=41274 RepID=UPI003F9DD56E
MFKITRKILKKMVEFKVSRSIPGRMRLKSKAPENIYKEAENYDRYLKRAILLLDGIEKVEFNYQIGTALIQYDIEKTYESKILKWINKIIEVGLKNQDIVAEYSHIDMEYLEKTLEQQLKEEVLKL